MDQKSEYWAGTKWMSADLAKLEHEGKFKGITRAEGNKGWTALLMEDKTRCCAFGLFQEPEKAVMAHEGFQLIPRHTLPFADRFECLKVLFLGGEARLTLLSMAFKEKGNVPKLDEDLKSCLQVTLSVIETEIKTHSNLMHQMAWQHEQQRQHYQQLNALQQMQQMLATQGYAHQQHQQHLQRQHHQHHQQAPAQPAPSQPKRANLGNKSASSSSLLENPDDGPPEQEFLDAYNEWRQDRTPRSVVL